MTRAHILSAASAGLLAVLCSARPSLGQTAGTPPAPAPAAQAQTTATPQQLQQVLDEIDRLKKEFEALRQTYDQRLSTLEQRIGGLTGGPNVPEAPPAAAPLILNLTPASFAPADQAPQQSQGNMAGAAKAFNPDISVIGNFIGVAGKNPMSTQSPFQLSEAEVAFQAVVDPYARADFFLSAGPEGLSVEEGFLTFNALPGGLLLKVGKMRAQFGKVNTMHTHALWFADRPLVTENLVGGEDGIDDSGVSVSKLIPNHFMFLEATGELYAGDSSVFMSDQRSKLAYVGRVRGYRDLTEGTNLDIGASVAFGPANTSLFPEMLQPVGGQLLDKRLIGFDATFRYRPLRRAIYKRFQARTELVWSRQDLITGTPASAFGFYGTADYQFARRWFMGARIDEAGRAYDATLKDKGGSFYMTYWPSEFSQIRVQYRHTSFAEGPKANEVLFQFNFSIGAHGAHVF